MWSVRRFIGPFALAALVTARGADAAEATRPASEPSQSAVEASQPASRASDEKALRVLERMGQEARKVQSLLCKVEWRVESKWFSQPKIKKATLSILKASQPDAGGNAKQIALVRYIQTIPVPRELYLTQDKAVEYLPDNKIARVVNVDRTAANDGDSAEAFEVLMAPEKLSEKFRITSQGELSLDGEVCDVLSLVPASDKVKSEYRTMELWISKDRALPIYMVGEKLDETTTHRIRFNSIEVNPKLSAKDFEFKAPAGVNVESADEIRL